MGACSAADSDAEGEHQTLAKRKPAKQPNFTVGKRFSVWVEKKIVADSMEDAVAQRNSMGIDSFLDVKPGVTFNDYDTIPGGSVFENFGD